MPKFTLFCYLCYLCYLWLRLPQHFSLYLLLLLSVNAFRYSLFLIQYCHLFRFFSMDLFSFFSNRLSRCFNSPWCRSLSSIFFRVFSVRLFSSFISLLCRSLSSVLFLGLFSIGLFRCFSSALFMRLSCFHLPFQLIRFDNKSQDTASFYHKLYALPFIQLKVEWKKNPQRFYKKGKISSVNMLWMISLVWSGVTSLTIPSEIILLQKLQYWRGYR